MVDGSTMIEPDTIAIENGQFVDREGRVVILRGINFAADAKHPASLDGTEPRSYVNSPCTLEEADVHLDRLKKLGFNCIRWIYTWDALQPEGPDSYDDDYIDYVIAMLRKVIDYGFYVFVDLHQDIWSRYSGGSGAPEWTLHAAGLDPRYFDETQAAMMWDPDQPNPIKMLWASNYHRLVCQTMFTLFFAGEEFAPKCSINGVNLGTYLETKCLEAVSHFLTRLNKAELGPKFLGCESINEPGHGLIGYQNLDTHPDAIHHVKLGTAPTPFQCFLLGSGVRQTVQRWRFTAVGLRKETDTVVSPSRGTWLTPSDLEEVDAKHNWKRSWSGGCIWELHGVYSLEDQKLLQPDYFTKSPTSKAKLDEESFVNIYFMRHWDKFVDLVESINPAWFRFMQAPVNVPPPLLTGRKGDTPLDIKKTVYTPHYYDGMTLMLKRWRWLNADCVGVMREVYSSPFKAVKVGSRSIRKSFVQQLTYLKDEGHERLGNIPVLMSEIGIPYDMDDKRAYKTSFWDLQVRAMDANNHGLEGSAMSHALWCYSVHNSHYKGDNFAGEDLSIYSCDDYDPKVGDSLPENGIRAPAAVIRPTPVAVAGRIISYSFDIYKASFTLTLDAVKPGTTEIYVPNYHFPIDASSIVVSSGTHTRTGQKILWDHEKGPQALTITGVPRFSDSLFSYIDPVQKLLSVVCG